MALDKNHGITQWRYATKTDKIQIDEYDIFRDLGKYPPAPVGQNNIWFHLVYDVNHGRCHKEIMVSGGHTTDIPFESEYSGVISICGI